MAQERQSPDGILAQTNLTGVLADIQDDPDSADTNWLVATGNNIDTVVRVSFPTPTDTPTTGAGLQQFRIWVRQFDTGQSGNPLVTIELWENGTLVRAGTPASITGSGQLVGFNWDAAELATADGSLVECRVFGNATGGSPTKRNTVDVGAVEWNAEISPSATAVGESIALDYDIAQFANESVAFVYDMSGSVTESVAFNYDLLNIISESSALRYDLLTLAAESVSFQYDTRQLANESLSLLYDMDGSVGESAAFNYDILNIVGESTAFQYDVLITASEALSLLYDIQELVGESLSVVYDLSGSVGESLSLVYDIQSSTLNSLVVKTAIAMLLEQINVRRPEMIVGDVGATIRLSVRGRGGATDISSATTKDIKMKKPNATVLTKAAVFTTDGTDGLIEYVTISGDIDQKGDWLLQAHIITPTEDYHTNQTGMVVDVSL